MLKPESNFRLEKKIFFSALDCSDSSERANYLEIACEGDQAMRDRINQLLESVDTEEESFMATEGPVASLRREFDLMEVAGTKVGNYTLVELLGEGTFGAVWRASQEQPVKRDVALKILKLGMDTREVLARFEQERQALALMDHPNIAKVYDAGATSTGRPFFAMELIDQGTDIADFCEKEKLSIEDRLCLFEKICRTVQHAHRKGVIHRDLKPSNILVSGGDLKEIKVIDFGIAKASEEKSLTDLTIKTLLNAPMGTPAYMSPEQFMGSEDIDTRTDVYSLGVILYELLTEVNPFTNDDGKLETPDIVAKRIPERVPRKPSTRTKSTDSSRAHEMNSELRGDLDSITLKALEADPDRRYESPGALADDLDRYIKKEPVLARPHSTLYLARLFARRHRGAVVLGATVFVALAIGLTVSSISLAREKTARERADREVVRSHQVSEILNNTLRSAGVSFSLGRDATMLKEILNKTAEGIEGELDAQPDIESEIRMVLGRTYEDLTDYENAGIHLTRAVELRRQLFRENASHYRILLGDAIYELAENTLSRGNTEESELLAKEAIQIFEQHQWEEPHAKRVKIAQIESLVGWTMFRTGRGKEAEEMMREGFEFWSDHSEIKSLYNIPKTYGTLLLRIGKSPEAEKVFRSELEQFRINYGHEHPVVCESLANFSTILIANGKLDEAEKLCLESLEQGRKFFNDRNPHGDHALGHLATIASKRGNFDKELNLRREAVASCLRTYPEKSVHRVGPINALVRAFFRHAELALKEGTLSAAGNFVSELEELGKNHPEAKIDADQLAKLKAEI